MPSNEHHEWLKKRDWPAVRGVMVDPDQNEVDLLVRKYKERDEHGRLPHHWMAAKAQTHTHDLAMVGVHSICYNLQALITRDKEGKTPLDIARRSEACAEIIGLLSQTPEEARSLGDEEMVRLYAPVYYWRIKMIDWINSRSYADCHKWINEHDDELVLEVLKFDNSGLLRKIAMISQVYSESLVFLALRTIHRNPLSLKATQSQGYTYLQMAESTQYNACREIRNVLRLTPKYISRTPFPTLLLQALPTKHHEIYGPYNTVCQFIKHMKYDKAELVEVEEPTLIYRMISLVILPGATREKRVLHEGMALLNMCIQRPGAGDGPTSVVIDFLRAKCK